MGLELSKELININQVIAEDYSQTLVEGDIIVPDVKPDILRILQVDGEVVVNGKEVQQDKVIVNGTVNFKILYIPDSENKEIKSIYANSNFTHQIEAKSAVQGMKAQVESDIEHIEFKMVNERKLNVKAIVSIDCKVQNILSLNMITDISGEEDIEVLKKNIKAYDIVAEGEEEFIITEDMEIPAGKPSIKDLLKVDIKITGKDSKVISNKVVIKGEFNVCTLYVGDMDDDHIQFMEHEVPFTEIFELDGVDEGMYCDIEYNITDTYFNVKEDSDGDSRVLGLEVTLNVAAKASQEVILDIVEDTYSPDVDINIEKKVYNIDEIIDISKTQATVKEIIDFPANIPNIVQIYNVITKPYISETTLENDRMTIEGVIDTYILYLSDYEESPVYSYKQEIPFNHTVDIKGVSPEMICDVKVEINHCSYSMSSASDIEIRCIVGVDSKIIKTTQVELVTKADIVAGTVSDDLNQPSITIYFVQQGDTLWKIAKQYRNTVEDIVRANNLEGMEKLKVGQQLFIPRRLRKSS
jgi:LysM repeat protein